MIRIKSLPAKRRACDIRGPSANLRAWNPRTGPVSATTSCWRKKSPSSASSWTARNSSRSSSSSTTSFRRKGLIFHPPCHVGDEWFVPVGIPAIFIPFFLVHDRLRQLERKIILEVEGETPEWFMKLIRHEAAHAYAYAYQLFRKRKWQQTFGLSSTEETPSFYRPRPYSRSFVVHLDDWYAQSHPDEDFAETFAVWLTPGLDWRDALQGLEGAAEARIRGRIDALARGQTAVAHARISRRRSRLPQRQAQDLLRAEAQGTMRIRSRTFTTTICGSSSTPARTSRAACKASVYLRRHRRAAGERRLPVDERKQISRQQTARAAD